MFFSKFEIKNFKVFSEKQTLSLAIPNEKEGSGITWLVGENNSGKTTLVEAININDKKKINTSELPPNGNMLLTLYDQSNNIVKQCKLIRPDSFSIQESPLLEIHRSFEIIASRRHWMSDASIPFDEQQLLHTSRGHSPRDTSLQNNIKISGILKSIEESTSEYPAFIEYVKEVMPSFQSYCVGFEDKEFILYKTKNGIKHKSDHMGDGVISILRILAHLFKSKDRPIIIEEPELSLHPNAQIRLLKLLAKEASNRQILITTHSPNLISWEYFKNGAKINRTKISNSGSGQIFTLGEYKTYENLIKAANWQQPFLMDQVAKEVFFMDSLLLLEGQEDVGLIKKDLKDYINIFGYGVRGKDNFEIALTLCKDLGIEKVACLLDYGASELAICDDLKGKFPNYSISIWNKEDIRDKPVITNKEKSGYFNEKGKKKNDEELDDYPSKIEELNNYFKPDL